MKKAILAFLGSVLVASSAASQAVPAAPQDRQTCKAAYDTSRLYVNDAGAFMWRVHAKGLVDYDTYNRWQNELVLYTRAYISKIRNKSYTGEGWECQRITEQVQNITDNVLLQFMRNNGLNFGN